MFSRLDSRTRLAEAPIPLGNSLHYQQVSATDLLELRSLEKENDPGLFLEGLVHWGQRLEASGHLEAAVEVYTRILNSSEHNGASTLEARSSRQQAKNRLDAILGAGDVGARSEFLLRRFCHEATDPATLISMAIGSAAFRFTRLAVLGHLRSLPAMGLLSRGQLPHIAASLAGFALEAPAFTLSAHGLRRFFGETSSSGGGSLSQEVLSSYLVLGSLKASGYLAGRMVRGLALRESSLGATFFRQGAALSGLLMGRKAEESLGLRPVRGGAMALVDSLATLAQFYSGGRILGTLLGPRFAAWERGLDLMTEGLKTTHPIHTNGASLAFAAGPLAMPSPRPAESMLLPTILQMSGREPKTPPSWTTPVNFPSPPRSERPIHVAGLYSIIRKLPAALKHQRPHVHYEGENWNDQRDAGAIAGRLREAIPLPRDKSFQLTLLIQKRHFTFFWEGEEIKFSSRTFENLSDIESDLAPQAAQNTAITVRNMEPVREVPKKDEAPSSGRYHHVFTSPQRPVMRNIWTEYRTQSDVRIAELLQKATLQAPASTHEREEASALRGSSLARILSVSMRQGPQCEPSLPPEEAAANVAEILSQAFVNLDFGTIESFRERSRGRISDRFSRILEWQHQDAAAAGRIPPMLLEDMKTDHPGNYLIPQTDALRSAFLENILSERSEMEAREMIPHLLQSPQALGRVHAEILREPMNKFFTNSLMLQTMAPEESLPSLLNPERTFRNKEARELQANIQAFLRETPEIARWLVGGKGAFHREYLRVLFFDASTPIRETYPPFAELIQSLPKSWSGLETGHLFLPSLGQIREFTRASAGQVVRR